MFREFGGSEKMIFFEHYSVLCCLGHETLPCSSFVSFGAVKSLFFLSITVFHDVQAQPRNTVMLKKDELFQALKRTKHCTAQKNSKILCNLPLAWP